MLMVDVTKDGVESLDSSVGTPKLGLSKDSSADFIISLEEKLSFAEKRQAVTVKGEDGIVKVAPFCHGQEKGIPSSPIQAM